MSPPSYRSIQPAPARGARSGSGAPSGSSSSSGSTGSGWLSAKGLTKRLKAVTQACHTCRRNKAKCDGVRPRCGACTARASPCGYDGEAGQSRQAALRARLEELEKMVKDLQSMSDADAEQYLRRIRSSANEPYITPLLSTETDSRSARQTTVATSYTSSESSFPGRSPESSTSPEASGSSVVAVTTLSDDASSPRATQPPADDLAALLHFDIPLPSAKTTWAGVQSFFSSTGRLFHIYTQQQMQDYYRTVFGVDGKADTSQKLAICCLYAFAAVGIQYNAGDFKEGLEKTFHDVSRRFFSEVMEDRPLDTIKVCTLFAMYNILDKATVALAYVEVGLSMSKRQSSSTGACHPSMVSSEEWIDFRRTWRALLFFASLLLTLTSWLSSTLGYISGSDDSEFAKLLPIAEQDHDSYSAELGELVQAEMTKISLLQAGILRNHLAVQELTKLGMDGAIRELQDWHGQLPEAMQLQSLYRTDWPPLVRWSIYHLHLLYHGAFMLVYRRIAAHCVRLQRMGGDLATAGQEPTLRSLVEQGITSARDTARIVSLLLGEQGVFKRCWIVIFAAHTACVVILHSVAQKQLHHFPPSAWADDMKRAAQCIDVLGYCGAADPVALRFRVRLSGIYDSLVSAAEANTTAATAHDVRMQRVADWVPPHPDHHGDGTGDGGEGEPHPVEYLFSVGAQAQASPALANLAFSLLFALCRPWTDPASLAGVQGTGGGGGGKVGSGGFGGGQVAAPPLEKLEWDFEKVTPFRWDTDGMGMLGEGEVAGAGGCFLDSEGPSGWKEAEDLEEGGQPEVKGEWSGSDEMVLCS
ncbi:hypothetical protein F5144DRAFT_642046 [Chaetomium tenue]|uniref:Uncharacterized protein n=1 Tax=Chaetomium tenue TaxID=1854479 RepID=A0ACB7PGW7_9PEZI|nr:hypothetical protein F5144DRAFT_642046 [Chaetomium globosum]